jgi:hypothetical protein
MVFTPPLLRRVEASDAAAAAASGCAWIIGKKKEDKKPRPNMPSSFAKADKHLIQNPEAAGA